MLGEITFVDTLLFWVYSVVILVSFMVVVYIVAMIVGGIFQFFDNRKNNKKKYTSENKDTLTYDEYRDKVV